MKTKIHFLGLLLTFVLSGGLVKSQWSSNPQINTLICDLQDRQTLPKVSATSDGGCFISWFDSRGNGQFKVYLQRLNPQGVKQFANDGLLVSDKPQNSFLGQYDLKTDGNDNAVLVFSDRRNSAGDTILNPFAYKISSTGQFLWGVDGVAISNNTAAYQVWPKVAVQSDGSALVAWWYVNSGQRNSWISIQRLNSSGVPQFTNPINIQDPGGKRYQYPDVCASDNGNYILSWVYGPKDTVGSFVPDNITIFTNKCDPGGNLLWGAGHKIVYTNTGNTVPIYCVPKIYTDGSGGALYSFFNTQGTGIYSRAHRFNSSGIPLFPDNGSEGSTNTQYIHVEPYLTYMPSTDQAFMFWTEADASTQSFQAIFGQGFSPDGTRLWGNDGKGYSVLDTVGIYGITCFARDTNVVVSYVSENYSGINSILKGFRVGKSGSYSWNTAPILCNVNSDKGYVSGTMANTGMTITVWEDDRNSSGLGYGGIYAQNLNYDGTIGTVGISQISSLIPDSYALHQNYPNPFNGQTLIEFDIATNDNYKFEIFDMIGKKVDELMNEYKNAGSYRIKFNADKISSGIYFYKLSSNNITLARKFILVK